MSVPSRTQRLTFFDSVRGLASILGVYYHVALLYLGSAEMAGYPNGPGGDGAVLDHLAAFIHTFRMPLFLVASGFFTRWSLERRSVDRFVANRLLRIGLPLVWSVLTILPLQEALTARAMGVPVTFDLLVASVNPFDPRFGWSHLWYLYYLVLYTLVILAWGHLREHSLAQSLATRVRLVSGRCVVRHYAVWVGTSLAVAAFSTVLRYFGFSQQSTWFPQVALLVYFPFFLYGWVMHSRREEGLPTCDDWSPGPRAAMAVVAWAAFAFSDGLAEWLGATAGVQSLAMLARLAVPQMASWVMVVEILRFAETRMAKRSSLLEYASKSSYPFYLFHNVAILVVAWLAAPYVASMPVLASYLVVSTASLALTYVMVELLVHRNRWGRLLYTGGWERTEPTTAPLEATVASR